MSQSQSAAPQSSLSTRERQRAETRDRILRVALAEIAAEGLAQARIEHIARKAAVTRPTIYAHFPEKEEFLRELERRTEARVLSELERRHGEARGVELLHRMVDASFDLVDSAHPVLRRETFSLLIREPPPVNWTGRALFSFVAAGIRESQARGELASSVSARELTRLVVTAIFGFLVVESESARTRRRAAHRMLDLLVAGAIEA